MKIQEIQKLIKARMICGHPDPETEINYGFASDLMSDVLTLVVEDVLLITGLCNKQTIRTAEMSDISYILFVRNKKITKEMIDLATQSDIKLLETEFSMFKASGILFNKGLSPVF